MVGLDPMEDDFELNGESNLVNSLIKDQNLLINT